MAKVAVLLILVLLWVYDKRSRPTIFWLVVIWLWAFFTAPKPLPELR